MKRISAVLKRLEAYNDSPSLILSVYLKNTSPEKLLEQFHTLLSTQLSESKQEQLRQNIDSSKGFLLTSEKKRGETLAIFSGGNNLFEVLHLPYAVQQQLSISHSPYIKPILEEQQSYRRYLVILPDREKAKFFTLFAGQLEDQGEISDASVPQQVHPGAQKVLRGEREDKINRHIQDHLNRHFELITHKITEFIREKSISGVIIGGHKNQFASFEKHLPKSLQEKIVGEFVSELHTNMNELLAKAQKIVKEVDREINNQHFPHALRV